MIKRLKETLIDFLQQADLVLLALCCAATLYGMALIASAVHYMDSAGNLRWTLRYVGVQGAALLIGVCAYILISALDLNALIKRWKWLVAFDVIFIGLLLSPFGVGKSSTGNQAWLKFPGIPFQIGPAEVVKISFTLLLAKQISWLAEEKQDLKSFRSAFFVAGHTLLLMGYYVVISGDMGNALTFFFIFLCMAFVAGFALRWFLLLIAGGGAAAAAVWVLDLLPSYMRERFLVLFDHSYDVQDAGWQQTRSLMAIGSGGVFGQGYMSGTQTQSLDRGSLPYRWTDLIFSVCGEELGLIGCLAAIALLVAIVFRVLVVAKRAENLFFCYTCVGIAAILIYQIIINIGMCLFVMPVIGITLPFFSYGGSSIVTLFAAMGIVSNIKKRTAMLDRRIHR